MSETSYVSCPIVNHGRVLNLLAKVCVQLMHGTGTDLSLGHELINSLHLTKGMVKTRLWRACLQNAHIIVVMRIVFDTEMAERSLSLLIIVIHLGI